MELKDWIEFFDSDEKLTKKKVAEAFKVAVEKNSAELAYKLALLPEEITNRKVAEKIVLKAKNPYVCYEFARDIPNANISAHQKICLKSNDYEAMIGFASDVPDADTKAFETIILSLQNPEYSYRFVCDVESANIKQHQKIVANSRNEEYIKKFRDLEYDGINKRKLNLALGRATRNKNAKVEKSPVKSNEKEFLKWLKNFKKNLKLSIYKRKIVCYNASV